MDIVGGIKLAIDTVKKAKEIADKLKDLELKGVIVDLQSQLIDLKEQINALREENIQLKADAQKLALPEEMVFKLGAYFRAEGDGPFCTGCFDTNGTAVRLVDVPSSFQRMVGKWTCPVCKAIFRGQ